MLLFCFQVSDVKAKIETEKGSDTFPSGKQKLIYNGKVLENADPLSKYEINEKKFLVVMVPKPQAPAKPAAETPAPAPPATPGKQRTHFLHLITVHQSYIEKSIKKLYGKPRTVLLSIWSNKIIENCPKKGKRFCY